MCTSGKSYCGPTLNQARDCIGDDRWLMLKSDHKRVRCTSRDSRKGVLSKHKAAMLQYNSALRLLFVCGALHRGCDLLMRIHIDDDPVFGQLLLHEYDLLCPLQPALSIIALKTYVYIDTCLFQAQPYKSGLLSESLILVVQKHRYSKTC